MNWYNQGTYTELLKLARAAARQSYTPYSMIPSGAAALLLNPDGHHTYTSGGDIEVAGLGASICAERLAVMTGVAMGYTSLIAVAISSPLLDEENDSSSKMPCGVCLQVFTEFAEDKAVVLVEGVGVYRLRELLPRARRLPKA